MTELNTFDTYDSPTNREDLHNIIVNTTPDETPLFSMLSTRKTKALKHEWPKQTNRVPSTNNAREQGYEYTFNAAHSPDRVGNYHQIFDDSAIIADTQEQVDKAGRESDVEYNEVIIGKVLRTDVEVTFLSNQASLAGSSSIPSRLGGLRAWLATNDDMGGGGSSGGFNSGTGVVDAATNGSQRAFSKVIFDNVIQGTYMNGGNPSVLMCSPHVKSVFSTFMSDTNVAQQRYAAKDSKQTVIIGAADTYLSNFGEIDVVPNRQMARVLDGSIARNAFLIDTDKIAKGVLQPFRRKKVARSSDGEPIVVNGTFTLIVGNEANHGVAADLYGMSASA